MYAPQARQTLGETSHSSDMDVSVFKGLKVRTLTAI